MARRPPLYGLLAEFADATALVRAADAVRRAGYTRTDAFSPFPVEGLAEALGFRRTSVPLLVLVGGLVGCVGGYLMQYYVAVVSYPLNVGGRPAHSWPMFLPVTFEMTVLVGALTAVLGMLALNNLPQPYHPVFHIERFARATQDGFFLSIQSLDPKFDLEATRRFLTELGPRQVWEVPR